MLENLKEYPVIWKQVVAWGDMDAFGHLNNVIYYRYIESSRIAYLQQVNAFDDANTITVVSSTSCRYLRPVIYPDTLLIGARVSDLRQSGLKMDYLLFSEQQQEIVAAGDAIVVFLDRQTNQKKPMPALLRQAILNLEQQINDDLGS